MASRPRVETIARAVVICLPVGSRRGDPLVASASAGSIRARRRVARANAGDDGRAARSGARRPDAGDCVSSSATGCTSMRRVDAVELPERSRPRRHPDHGGRRRGGRAHPRSRVARRAGARRVRSRHCRARPRESSDSVQRCGHSSRRFEHHANESSLPPTPSAAGSSATCTMARSSGSSPCRSRSDSRRLAAIPQRPRSSRARRTR